MRARASPFRCRSGETASRRPGSTSSWASLLLRLRRRRLRRWRARAGSRLLLGRAGRSGLRSRNHEKDHASSFHARRNLDLSNRLEILHDTLQETQAGFGVRHLTPTKRHREFDLVVKLEKLPTMLDLEPVIVFLDLRSKLDFLQV